jgi:hypothetical protein
MNIVLKNFFFKFAMKLCRLVLDPLEEDRVVDLWKRPRSGIGGRGVHTYRSEGSSISRIYSAKKRIRMGGGEAFPLI